MSNSLLESLWSRIDANIGARITQISDLLTQALSANMESIAARDGAVSAAGDAASSASNASTSEGNAAVSESNAASSEVAAGRSESNASSHAETAGTFAQNAQTSASSASQSRQYAATSAQQANESALTAGQAKDDAVAAAGLAEEQAGIATAAAGRADPDGFRDAVDQRVSTVEGLVDSKADKSHAHTVSDLTDYPGHAAYIGAGAYGKIPVREPDSDNLRAGYSPTEEYHAVNKKYVDDRPALFSGSGAPPSSIPSATVGDWWLDTSTMELHKITGV